MDFERVKQVVVALEEHGVRYAIFGGVALNLHGLARFTEDIDLFIAPDTANVEALKAALRRVYDDPSIDEISADDLLGDCPAVQYVPPEGEFHLDILTRLGNAFHFADLETQRIRFDDLTVTVVTPAMLHRMKRDTVRLKDKADAQLLRERFKISDP